MLDGQRIRAGDATLHCVQAGSGEPLVFVNGISTDLTIWSRQLQELSKDHRVVLFDHRGTGHSERSDGGFPYSMEALATDALRLLDALDIPCVHLVGHSMGGLVTQHMALQAPDRVRTLILAAAFARAPKMAHITYSLGADLLENVGVEAYVNLVIAQNYAHRYVEENYRELLLMRRLLVRQLEEAPIDATVLRRQVASILAHDTQEALSRLDTPTLVLVGEHDVVVPAYAARDLAERIPNARLEVLNGCAHNLMIERPTEFNGRVRAFIAENARP